MLGAVVDETNRRTIPVGLLRPRPDASDEHRACVGDLPSVGAARLHRVGVVQQLDTSTWTVRLDTRLPERDVRGYLLRRTIVASIAGALFAASLVLLFGPWLESIQKAGMLVVAAATGVVTLVVVMQRWRVASIASLQGADRIVAVVLDEGIVLQGGLVLRWPEIGKVQVARRRRTGRGAADAVSRRILAADGVSNVWTTVALELVDWPTVESRATTKQLARPLTRPLLGMPAAATLDLGALPEPDVQQVLGAIVQQANRHGIEVATS